MNIVYSILKKILKTLINMEELGKVEKKIIDFFLSKIKNVFEISGK